MLPFARKESPSVYYWSGGFKLFALLFLACISTIASMARYSEAYWLLAAKTAVTKNNYFRSALSFLGLASQPAKTTNSELYVVHDVAVMSYNGSYER